MSALALLWMVTTVPPVAATTAESDLVWILEGEVVPEDLYAVGNNIRVSGRVEGDLVAAAAEELLVEGTVAGSVTVLASRVVIEGVVEGSVRGVAGEVIVTGRVGGDVVVGVGDLRVAGEVERDVLAAAWSGVAGGKVGRDLRGLFRSVRLGGEIEGDVEIRTDRLETENGLSILGDLVYEASHLLEPGELSGYVDGSVLNRRALPPNVRIRAFGLMVYLFSALSMMVGGLVMIRLAPRWVEAAASRTAKAPLRSLGKGLAVFLSPVIGLALLGVVVRWFPIYVWGPILVVAIPLLLSVTGGWLSALLVAHVPVAMMTGRWLGRMFGRDWERSSAYLVGAIAYLLALRIPVVGGLLVAIATIIGAGGWLKGPVSRPKSPRRFDIRRLPRLRHRAERRRGDDRSGFLSSQSHDSEM